MSLKNEVEINITDARWISGYVLELSFSDGFARMLDFEPFLQGSLHPGIRKYLDIERFKGFAISFGNLVWNDYDLCFPIEDLYAGSIGHHAQLQDKVAENPREYSAGGDAD